MSLNRFGESGPSPIVSGVFLDTTNVSADDADYRAGTRFADAIGNEYVRVRADATVSVSDTLRQNDFIVPAVNAVVDEDAAAGTFFMTGTGDFTSFVSGGLEDAMVLIDSGVARGQKRWIKRVVDANAIEVTEAWEIALDSSSNFLVIRPWRVRRHEADATPVVGIAMAGAVVGELFWAQVSGIASVLIDTSEDPIIAGDIVTQSLAQSGRVEGRTAAGTNAADISGMVGIGIYDAALNDTVTVKLNLLGKL